jgi:hypothetical protein
VHSTHLFALSFCLLGSCSHAAKPTTDPRPRLVGDSHSAATQPDTGLAAAGFSYVAAEFMTLPEIEAQLPVLAHARVDVALAWPVDDLDNPARWALVRKAHKLGIKVHPWPLQPRSKGYWSNSVNAVEVDVSVRKLLAAWQREQLPPARLVIDMEPPIERLLKYAENLKTPLKVVAMLKESTNKQQYADATRLYRALAEHAHTLGWKVEITTFPDVVADYLDGDDDIRQALNVPVDDIPWDVITIQSYRTLAKQFTPGVLGEPTAYYVYDLAERAKKQWGERAAIVIGLTDPGDVQPDVAVYPSPAMLREDLNAAVSAGIARDNLGIYALRGLVRKPPAEQWLLRAEMAPEKPSMDVPSSAILLAMKTLDGLL